MRRLSWPIFLPSTGGRALIATAITVLASLGPGSPALAAPQPPTPLSVSDVRVVSGRVTALVAAPGGDEAALLAPGAVHARMGGADVPVTVQPVDRERRVTTLLVDTSGSMGASGMVTVARAAGAFLDAAPVDVLVGLVAFSDAPHVVVAPTTDRASVRAAIGRLESRGETTLYDGILTALSQMGSTGDRSFILLSDGGDTRSRHTLSQTLAALTSSGVRAEMVGLRTDETQAAVLSQLAGSAQGNVAWAGDAGAVDAAFSAAARALRSQVRMSLTPPDDLTGVQPLEVEARVNDRPVAAHVSVDLLKDTPAAAPPQPASVKAAVKTAVPRKPVTLLGGLPMTLVAGLVAIFVGLCGVVLALAAPALESRRSKRLRSIEQYVPGQSIGGATAAGGPSSLSESLVTLGDKVMQGRESTSRTLALLERADLPWRAGEWAVLRVVAVFVGVAGGVLLLHGGAGKTAGGVIVGVGIGVVAPVMFLRFAARRRSRAFEAQLPDVLSLVASSLSTGFSLLQGIDAVARDAAEPAAKEFSRALAESRIGADIDESLSRMATRMDSENLRWTSMAIRIQRQVGGNLAETLRTTAKTLRERESLRRHIRGLSAEGRLSAYILIALPVGLFFYMNIVNPQYIALLWSSLLGIGMLAAGVVSLTIGVFWMRKVVDVEV